MAFLVAPALEVYLCQRPFALWLAVPASAGLLLATALRLWVFSTLGGAWTADVVAPPEHEVATRGPYALIRHPNYLVVILEIACLPLFHSAWLSALLLSLLNGGVLLARIRHEETVLNTVPSWRRAMGRRKRLLPGLL